MLGGGWVGWDEAGAAEGGVEGGKAKRRLGPAGWGGASFGRKGKGGEGCATPPGRDSFSCQRLYLSQLAGSVLVLERRAKRAGSVHVLFLRSSGFFGVLLSGVVWNDSDGEWVGEWVHGECDKRARRTASASAYLMPSAVRTQAKAGGWRC